VCFLNCLDERMTLNTKLKTTFALRSYKQALKSPYLTAGTQVILRETKMSGAIFTDPKF
jgi:hypothetical protein